MQWLSPFLTWQAFIEFAVVLAVAAYLGWNYRKQKAALSLLDDLLERERDALEQAQRTVAAPEAAERDLQAKAEALRSALKANTLVWKRVNLTARNTSRRPEVGLPREYNVITDEARYWQGAFVFIGLVGTLICLGLAVLSLSYLVGRNSGAGAGMTTNLKEVVSHMTAVFGGMGAAFGSTAAGVGFTLSLAGRLSSLEREWEIFRDELEEFSLMEVEPLENQLREHTRDLPRLETIVSRMEAIATTFTTNLEKAVAGVHDTSEGAKALRAANEEVAKSLASTASTLDVASDSFGDAAQALEGNLKALQASVDSHGEATKQWNADGKQTLTWLYEAVTTATRTFAELDQLRQELLTATNTSRAEVLESTRASHELSRTIHGTHTSTLAVLRENTERGLLGVKDAIDKGVEKEAEVIAQFRAVLQVMGDYAMRVEDAIRQRPSTLGSEPLFYIENAQQESFALISKSLDKVSQEMAAMRSEMRDSLGNQLPEALRGSFGGLQNTGRDVSQLRGEVGAVTELARQSNQSIEDITARLNTVTGQISQLQSTVSEMDRSVVLRLKWPFFR